MIYKLSLVVLTFGLSACIKIRDPKKEAEKSQNAPHPVTQISYEITPLPQPNRYLVKFLGLTPEALLQRSAMNGEGKVELQALSSQEDVVSSGGLYEYRFQDQGHEQRIEVQVPSDLVIEGDQNVSNFSLEDLKNHELGLEKVLKVSGRLYLKANSFLNTQGMNILIEADSIESEGATLQSFRETEALINNQNGKSGGKLYLKARSLRGTTQVIMRGQTAYNIFAPGGRTQGFNGGNSGELWVDIPDLSRGFIHYKALPGEAGPGGAPFTMCGFENRSACGAPPAAGPPGSAGLAQPACLVRDGKCEELKSSN